MRLSSFLLRPRVAAAALIAAGALALGVLSAPTQARAADIVDIAANNEDFETLVAAVSAADLVDTLKGPGPFTVFAPTDAAFAALPDGLLESLLKPENKGQLTDILLYHVDDRALFSSQLPHRTIPIRPILSSEKLCVTRRNGEVSIGDGSDQLAFVVAADIRADNGVIHVIDKVLIPGRKRCGH